MSSAGSAYILIIGGEFALRERILAGALRAGGGMPVYVLARSRASTTVKFYDGTIPGDLTDPEGVLAAVLAHEKATGERPAAVVPVNDFAVRSALAVSQYFDLVHNPSSVVERCRDKFVMKEVLAAAGLPVPKFGAFRTLQELHALADDIGFPLVIKPRQLTGSVGVIKISDRAELEAAYRQCIADIDSLGGAFKEPLDIFQAEEYIPAQAEVSVEVFNHGDLHRVLAVTDKYLGAEPHFVETGHTVPSIYQDHAGLRDIAERSCAALGIRWGMGHFEARITPAGEIRIVEIAARTGGDSIMDLVERAFGVNPYQLHVASYLGKMPDLPDELPARGLGAVAFLKAAEGVIEAVKVPDTLPAEVTNMQVTGKLGDRSYPLNSWHDREGSIEFFWPGRKPEPGFDGHLRQAEQLSAEIFRVRPVAAQDPGVELVAVGDAASRADARALLMEYLEWIGAQASSNYGLDFDIAAMAESDLADPVKFFPPAGRFYVVRHAGRAIGVGCLKELAPGVAEIQRMYIQPAARGLGAGRALVDRLIADARAIGYGSVRLESLKVLAPAHTLYRSVGFREIEPYGDNSMADYQSEEKLATYRSSALFMELRL